jgi:hypothetical protein
MCFRSLKQFSKFLDGQSGVLYDSAQCIGFDRIVSRNGDLMDAIAHDDVLALADDAESCLFPRRARLEDDLHLVFSAQLNLNFHVTDFGIAIAILQGRQVFANRVLDIGKRFFLGVTF